MSISDSLLVDLTIASVKSLPKLDEVPCMSYEDTSDSVTEGDEPRPMIHRDAELWPVIRQSEFALFEETPVQVVWISTEQVLIFLQKGTVLRIYMNSDNSEPRLISKSSSIVPGVKVIKGAAYANQTLVVHSDTNTLSFAAFGGGNDEDLANLSFQTLNLGIDNVKGLTFGCGGEYLAVYGGSSVAMFTMPLDTTLAPMLVTQRRHEVRDVAVVADANTKRDLLAIVYEPKSTLDIKADTTLRATDFVPGDEHDSVSNVALVEVMSIAESSLTDVHSVLLQLPAPTSCIALSPSSQTLCIGCEDGSVHMVLNFASRPVADAAAGALPAAAAKGRAIPPVQKSLLELGRSLAAPRLVSNCFWGKQQPYMILWNTRGTFACLFYRSGHCFPIDRLCQPLGLRVKGASVEVPGCALDIPAILGFQTVTNAGSFDAENGKHLVVVPERGPVIAAYFRFGEGVSPSAATLVEWWLFTGHWRRALDVVECCIHDSAEFCALMLICLRHFAGEVRGDKLTAIVQDLSPLFGVLALKSQSIAMLQTEIVAACFRLARKIVASGHVDDALPVADWLELLGFRSDARTLLKSLYVHAARSGTKMLSGLILARARKVATEEQGAEVEAMVLAQGAGGGCVVAPEPADADVKDYISERIAELSSGSLFGEIAAVASKDKQKWLLLDLEQAKALGNFLEVQGRLQEAIWLYRERKAEMANELAFAESMEDMISPSGEKTSGFDVYGVKKG